MSDTRIVIAGTAYGLEDSLGRASLGDLYFLKTKLGVSVKTITATFQKFSELGAESDVLDILDDADVLLNMQGIVWLAKRKGGENVTLEEAGQISFVDVSFESDEEPEAALPKELTDSAVDESAEATAQTK